MDEAFAYCVALVRAAARDRFLSALFAPASHRPALFALYAFDAEIARVRNAVSGPLPGEIRLQWWDDVLAGIRPEEASANPVSAALLATVARHGLSVAALRGLIAAHRFDLYDDVMPSLAALDEHLTDTAGTVFACAFQVLHGDALAPLAQHCGIAYGIGALLTDVIAAGAFIPADVIARTGLERTALAELRLHARHHLAAARDTLPAIPPEVLPALLPLALVRPTLALMERADYDPTVPVALPQWRRQWLIWRAARRPKRIF